MPKRVSDLETFLAEVRQESAAVGAAEHLEAYGDHFRLAAEVIRLRQQRGWTQQALAKASGVQQSEISRIERGQANPTYRTLQALAVSGKMTVAFISAHRARAKAKRRTPVGRG